MGVTMHMFVPHPTFTLPPCFPLGLAHTPHRHIGTARNPIPDVPVIYLAEPTSQNLTAITNDLQKGLYSPAHINFLSSIPRVLLEEFATETANAGTSEHIAQLYDQYLNFIVAEPDLFSLGMQKEHTYWALNSAKTSDAELDRVVDKIVSGLFSVVVTMGRVDCSLFCDLLADGKHRRYPHNSVSEGCSRRDDCGQARPEASRPHSQLQR